MSAGRTERARDELARAVAWIMAELYAPNRTKAGNVSKSKGVIKYSDDCYSDLCAHLVGLSIAPKQFEQVQRGEKVAPAIELVIARMVDRVAVGGIDYARQQLRRDKFSQAAEHGLRFFERFDIAPDGCASLVEWLDRIAVSTGGTNIEIYELAARLDGWSSLRRAEATRDSVPFELKPLFKQDGSSVVSEDTPESVRRLVEGRLCHL